MRLPVVGSGALDHLLALALVYPFAPMIFSRKYFHWDVPLHKCLWIVALPAIKAGSMAIMGSVVPSFSRLELGVILALAPTTEELARAVLIVPLADRLGAFWGVAITSVFYAMLHAWFWPNLFYQAGLSIIFLGTRRSLPAAMTAHFLVNLVVVLYPLAHSHLHL
jgi:membrane protease YdiL (CAAX protease family)